jgi:hypothetical protein
MGGGSQRIYAHGRRNLFRAARGEPEPAPDPATHIRVDGGARWIPREG